MSDFLSSLSSVGSLALFILGFGFLVFVHELGHFLVAKWVGIRATQFAIGFGHSLLTWRKGIGFRVGSTEPEYEKRARQYLRDHNVDLTGMTDEQKQRRLYEAADQMGLGETEYRLNWLPLGGYVKMLGQEDMDPGARSDDPRSFNAKPIWARAAVISAGVTMNLITGAIFFVIAFSAGVDFPPAVVGMIAPGSPAADTYAQGHDNDPAYQGLRPGDVVTHINGEEPLDFTDLALGAALGAAGEPVHLRIDRDGHELDYAIVPVKDLRGLQTLGIMPPLTVQLEPQLKRLPPELRNAGVKPGWAIESVDGRTVRTFGEFDAILDAKRGEPAEVTFAGDDGRATLTLRAEPMLTSRSGDKVAHLLGMVPLTKITDLVEPTPSLFSRLLSFGRAPAPTPAQAAGLQADDLVQQLGDTLWPSPSQFLQIIKSSGGLPMRLVVLRNGDTVDLGTIRTNDDGIIGVVPGYATRSNLLSTTLENSPAAAGMDHPPAGSRIIAVNGTPVADFGDLQRVLADLAAQNPDGFDVEITYADNLPEPITSTSRIQVGKEDAAALAAADWRVNDAFIDLFKQLKTRIVARNVAEATLMGVRKTHQIMLQTYLFIFRATQGSLPLSQAAGPIGIVHYGATFTSYGWPYLMFFLGLISINLVVINLLPVPIVDGGHLVFLAIEKIKGSPVSARVQTAATLVGLVLLGSLFLFVTYHDIGRLLG